jgi:hypothetical protein
MFELTAARPKAKRARRKAPAAAPIPGRLFGLLVLLAFAVGIGGVAVQAGYSVSWQSPVRVRLQWPLVITARQSGEETAEAQADQSACRIALAVQRAENPRGACEIYHYNTDGTLDWGYFQINTVHLKRPGLNLRDLLDCRANIDFAYQLYTERGFEPWTTYTSGAYKRYLRSF